MFTEKNTNSEIEKIVFLKDSMDRKGIKNIKRNFVFPDSDLVLNLRDVKMIDSAGIGYIVLLLKNAYSKGYSLRLTEVPVKVRMLLELTQVDQVVEIVDNPIYRIPVAA